MRKFFYAVIGFGVVSLFFQACVTVVNLEVNPGFSKTKSSNDSTGLTVVGSQAEKPIWKVGYKWVYEWERPDSSGTLTRKIVREETFDGVPCFVIKSRKSELFYTKNVLGYLASKRRGKVNTKRSAPRQRLAWPLRVGRQWNNVYKLERVQEESSFDIDFRVVVAKLEEITVPAGKFKAFKIEVYRSFDGRLESEHWYSPKVKSFVKHIAYVGSGSRPREERLKSYTIN